MDLNTKADYIKFQTAQTVNPEIAQICFLEKCLGRLVSSPHFLYNISCYILLTDQI